MGFRGLGPREMGVQGSGFLGIAAFIDHRAAAFLPGVLLALVISQNVAIEILQTL